MIRAAALALMLALAGCAAAPQTRTVTRTKFVTPDVPPALLVCPPDPPAAAAKMQSQVAAYLARVWRSGQVCRAHLSAVRHILEPHHGH